MTSEVKVYSKNAILIMTFICGPLAGAYMMTKNFELFGDTLVARRAKGLILAAAILIAVYLVFPFEFPKGIERVLPLVYTLIIYQCTVKWQGANLRRHFENGGMKHSVWRVLLVSIVALLITLLYLLAIILCLPKF